MRLKGSVKLQVFLQDDCQLRHDPIINQDAKQASKLRYISPKRTNDLSGHKRERDIAILKPTGCDRFLSSGTP